MQRVYSLISKAKVFRDILLSPIIDQVMKHMFYRETFHDKYYLTSFHANLLEPKSSSQIWHIDANVPEPIPPWIIRFNTNYITQEYTKEGGSTEVIPGSHLWNRKPNAEEAEKGIPEAESVFLEASKGSIAFWHGHLWHRSGENKTEITRVALLGAYTASHLREVSLEENPYRNLNINIIEDLSDELKRVIGWDHGAKYYY